MTGSIEVVYRGIFLKTLGQRITRGIDLAAVKEGKTGISFGQDRDLLRAIRGFAGTERHPGQKLCRGGGQRGGTPDIPLPL